jgi:molybdopterin-guanine dinucleotide biosynthesis protein A
MREEASAPLGVVLAGGESSRYGSPKALATVSGVRIVDRVVRALEEVVPDVVVSANEPALFASLGLPIYTDARTGLGPLAGIHTTLLRAREAGRPGILAVACDMPFPSVALLDVLARTAFGGRGPEGDGAVEAAERTPGSGRPDVVVPESRGRRGVEPLFAAYGTGCIEVIEAALAAGDRRVIGFHDRATVHAIPLAEVESVCDPAVAFLNVNTREDRDRAESLAAEHEARRDESESGRRDRGDGG